MDVFKTEFQKKGLEGYDVERHFSDAVTELKKGTSSSIRKAKKSFSHGKSEADRLKVMRDDALDMVLEIEDILDDVEPLCTSWSTRNEYDKIKASVEEGLRALDWGNYELALKMSRSTVERARELRDIRHRALRSSAKASHMVRKVRKEATSSKSKELKKFDSLLSTIRHLLEKEDYKTAQLLAKEVKHEAEMLLPPGKTGDCAFVCPICFDTKCPNTYCGSEISPSMLVEDTCRTYCQCGTFYHICCIQEKENLTCVSCYIPLFD
jgi:hypothetical protein